MLLNNIMVNLNMTIKPKFPQRLHKQGTGVNQVVQVNQVNPVEHPLNMSI